MPDIKMRGIDVSRYQGNINWTAVKAAGYHAAVIKATQSTSYGWTPYFFENIQEAVNAGVRVGAYHFLVRGEGAEQADYFWEILNRTPIAHYILPVLDVETNPVTGLNPRFEDIEDFCHRFKDISGIPPVLYTYNSWWQSNVGSRPIPCPDLWIARYRNAALGPGPTPPCENLIGWQHSSTGSVPGISGNVDLNHWYIDGQGWDNRTIMGSVEEDDMKEEDWVRLEQMIGRTAHHIMTGQTNSMYNPAREVGTFKYDWADDSDVGVRDLMPKGLPGQMDVSRGVIEAFTSGNPELPDWFRQTVKDCVREVMSETNPD